MLLVILPVLSLSSKPSGALSWLMPEAPDVELDIDQEMLNAVPEYIHVLDMKEAGGEDQAHTWQCVAG